LEIAPSLGPPVAVPLEPSGVPVPPEPSTVAHSLVSSANASCSVVLAASVASGNPAIPKWALSVERPEGMVCTAGPSVVAFVVVAGVLVTVVCWASWLAWCILAWEVGTPRKAFLAPLSVLVKAVEEGVQVPYVREENRVERSRS
jgi:hypothetical protein